MLLQSSWPDLLPTFRNPDGRIVLRVVREGEWHRELHLAMGWPTVRAVGAHRGGWGEPTAADLSHHRDLLALLLLLLFHLLILLTSY